MEKHIWSKNPQALLKCYTRKKAGTKCNQKCTKLEIYSELYYKQRFLAKVQKELEDTAPLTPESRKQCSAQKMAIYLKHQTLAWESETNEIKTLIDKIYNQEHGTDQSGDEDNSEVDGADNTKIQELECQQVYVHVLLI